MNSELSRLTAELAAAEDDLALLQRLNSAETRVKGLSQALAKAKAANDRDEAARAAAAREARFDGLADIRVSDVTGAGLSNCDGPLHRQFKISYTAPAWEHSAWGSGPRAHSVVGFGALPQNVLAFLIEKHPEQIPQCISELAPGDPYAAFEILSSAKRRGYLRGKTAA